MHAIATSGLTKHYGPVVGVEGVNLSVEPGEVFGFLGPNGAGKTTTIRLIMHLLEPDSGDLEIFGRPRSRQTAELRERIGYLPGEFRPYVEMRAGQFLDYMARFRSRPPRQRALLSEKLHLTSQDLRRRIKHLSHGNRQKIGIISALEHEPDLAVLDEPTIGLDPLMQTAFYEVVHSLRAAGRTVFLSSHLLSEVERICDRVAIIRNGRVVALESIEELKRKRPRRLIIQLSDAAAETPLLPGAKLLSREGRRAVYIVDADLGGVLSELGALFPGDFFLPEPDLEDVFMAHYREEEAS